MKVVRLDTRGIHEDISAFPVRGKRGNFWCLLHGEEGRGRWEIRIPLGVRDFGAPKIIKPEDHVTTEKGNMTYFSCPDCGHVFFSMPDYDPKKPPLGLISRFCERCCKLFLKGLEFRLIRIPDKKDPKGNPVFLLGKGEKDGHFLVLWRLSPGYRGWAEYQVEGNAEVIALGHEAQGLAGRMGGAPCPVVLITGPCVLKWQRKGRLYGTPANWIAEFDGDVWTVAPEEECVIEEAALEY